MGEWEKYAKQYQTAWIDDLAGLVAIKSVRDDTQATPAHPYGPDVKAALDFMLQMAQRDGFTYGQFENKVGWIDFGPQDAKDFIGVLIHVDVVQVNDLPQWTVPPFELTNKNGLLYGRGVDDMKGSDILTYYALKAIAESGVALKRKIRLIIGTDEENEWGDMVDYFANNPKPVIGFSPDGVAQVANGEKGISQLDVYFTPDNGVSAQQLLSFHSGAQTNIVPGEATAVVKGLTKPEAEACLNTFVVANELKDYIITEEVDDTLTINVSGKATHASRPESGINAATHLAHFLLQYDFSGTAKQFLTFLGTNLYQDDFGEKSGYGYETPEMGKTTQNIGITDFELKGSGHINFNFRYALGFDEPAVAQQIADLPWVDRVDIDPAGLVPHFVPADDPVVTTLLTAYEDVLGHPTEHVVNGGASFGRLLERGVGFGAWLVPELNTAHQADEHIPISWFEPAFQFMAAGIVGLANLE
ncbi:MAG: Sapep family Mn(2+)-dependent dipeptidase [Lactobacillaceae bacterium]|jgi:predicted dipeptidase|nr:Sapep family Mn(2+)-dependent dipeptidase [Lactobacillaceae bacterium]